VLVVICLVFTVVVAVCAVAGPLIAPHDPLAQDLLAGLQSPSGAHPLGTDDSGRDILSRLIVGTKNAVVGPLVIALAAALLGTALGLLAGYRGGWVDAMMMRTVDLLYAMPGLLVAIVLLGVFGGGYWSAVWVLMLLTVPYNVRIVRGATLEQRGLPYVDAARTLGLRPGRIMFVHIGPNALPHVAATAFLNFAHSLVALSALSFLGLGAAPGSPDWGRMLADNLDLIRTNPLSALVPGTALVLTAISVNLLGDWCYERLAARGRTR
jgi:peptide/nickel transport system permease protein